MQTHIQAATTRHGKLQHEDNLQVREQHTNHVSDHATPRKITTTTSTRAEPKGIRGENQKWLENNKHLNISDKDRDYIIQ
jgi:hypothetical protein